MGAMASQITSLTIVYSTVYSGADERKHQSSASLVYVRKRLVKRKMFPFDDVIMGAWMSIYILLETNLFISCSELSYDIKRGLRIIFVRCAID